VPAEQIAQNLAYINWTLLTGLAVGCLGAAVLGRLTTAATRGYLGFIAAAGVVLALLAVSSDSALPVTAGGSPIAPDAAWEGARRGALWLLAGLGSAFVVVIARRGSGRVVGLATLGMGLAVLLAGAMSWGGDPVGRALLFVQLAALAAASGGGLASMVLGHWYLVTPKLPEAPLVRFARALEVIVLVQLALFVVWLATGAGPGGSPAFGALTGSWALFVWLRLVVGLAMPLVISWAAVQTARTRSMESATGLLYIDVGLVAAGTILAAGLYFGAGLLV